MIFLLEQGFKRYASLFPLFGEHRPRVPTQGKVDKICDHGDQKGMTRGSSSSRGSLSDQRA